MRKEGKVKIENAGGTEAQKMNRGEELGKIEIKGKRVKFRGIR
jgi:hypothetical protein